MYKHFSPELYKKNSHVVALNLWRSFMIMYYRACETSSLQDWFAAARIAKQFEHYLRTMSLWQQFRFVLELGNQVNADKQYNERA